MSGTVNARLTVAVTAINTAALTGLQQQIDRLHQRIAAFDLTARTLDRTLKYLLAGTVIGLTASFVKMMSDLERLNITMATVENSFDKAGTSMDRLLKLAANTPYSLNAISESFIKMRSAGIEPIIDGQGNGPLKNLIDAVAAFGGSDEQLRHVALALEQMAGKGVISMEELRRQMGQQIPTAMKLMAEGMGISVAKLISDVSKGVVQFDDAVTPMLEKFGEKYRGAAQLLSLTFAGAIRQTRSEVQQFALSLNRAGVLDVFTAAIKLVAEQVAKFNASLSDQSIKAAMDSIFNFVQNNVGVIGRGVAVVYDFGRAFGIVVKGIFDALSQLPAEAVAGGILGWLIFGRAGLLAGAILGPFTDIVMGVAAGVAALFQSIISIASAIGLEGSELATYGLIGWLLFGRVGLLAGVVTGLLDNILGGVRRLLANMFAEVAGFKSAMLDPFNFSGAYEEGRKSFLRNNTNNPENPTGGEGFFGFGNINNTPLQDLRAGFKKTDADATAASINNITVALAGMISQVQDARKQFDKSFGTVDSIPGLSPQAQRGIENFGKALGAVEDRLAGAEGSSIDAWVSRQQRVAAKFQSDVIDPMQRSWQKLMDQGKSEDPQTQMLGRSIQDAEAQLRQFNATVERTAALEKAKIGARGEAVVGRFGNAMQAMREQLDAFEARFDEGKKSADAEVAKASAQFAPMIKQLENMKIGIGQLRGAEGSRSEALEQILALEKRVNEVREKAIEIARRKANREQEDTLRDTVRANRGFQNSLITDQLSLMVGGSSFAEVIGRFSQAQSQVDSITDKITELRRKLEDQPQDTWLAPWIAKLTEIREGFIKIRDAIGTVQEGIQKAGVQLMDGLGKALEDGIVQSLEVIINKTGSLRDVVKSMYADITRAAIQYLMKIALFKLGSPDGSIGGLLGSLGGAGEVASKAVSTIGSANGNAFLGGVQRFASGAGFTNSIVHGPTRFNIGEMGEAGPEGVMPLANVGGKLGVYAKGRGGDQYHINISAVDAASVERLFYANGDALVGVLHQRARINRGYKAAV